MTPSTGPLMSLSDVAHLARVRRPVVSMWRNRATVRGETIAFPASVLIDGSVELFDAESVADWLDRTGRGNNDDARADLYAHVRLPAVSSDRVRIDDAIEALLCLRALTGDVLGDLDIDDTVDLADAVDPDDVYLFSEVEALGDELPSVAAFVDRLVDAAYTPAGGLDVLRARRSGARLTLSASARRLVGEVGAALALDLGAARVVVSDPTGAAPDLVDAVMSALEERLDVTVSVPADADVARSARRAHLIHGWSLTGARSGDDAVVAVARFPHSGRPDLSSLDILTAVDDLQLDLGEHHRAVVLGPAAVLCDALPDPSLQRQRDDLLRLGRLRCAVRLPKGLVSDRSRQALAMWVLGPETRGVPVQDRLVSTADLGDVELSPDVVDTLVTDVVASLDARLGTAHAFRFARLSPTAAVLARRGPLVVTGFRAAPTTRGTAAGVFELRSLADAAGLSSRLTIEPAQGSRSMPSSPLGDLVADGSVRLLPGARLDPAEMAPGTVRVIQARDVLEHDLSAAVRVDALDLEGQHARVRRTEPGDVVVVTAPRPSAVVDRDGLSVVAYPARVLRCHGEWANPHLVARAINDLPERARSWRGWLVPRAGSADDRDVDAAVAALEVEVAALRRRLAATEALAGALVRAAGDGVHASLNIAENHKISENMHERERGEE